MSEEGMKMAMEQGMAQFESIKEMVEALRAAQDGDDQEALNAARMHIEEDPLSIEVRSGWHSPGEKFEAEEFRILLCTGGPAVQIMGTLNEHHEPEECSIYVQNWFTPWTVMPLPTPEDYDILKEYCQNFYFG